eukprot:Platyproteum_vivax@DN4220_c0_g1_i1.p1
MSAFIDWAVDVVVDKYAKSTSKPAARTSVDASEMGEESNVSVMGEEAVKDLEECEEDEEEDEEEGRLKASDEQMQKEAEDGTLQEGDGTQEGDNTQGDGKLEVGDGIVEVRDCKRERDMEAFCCKQEGDMEDLEISETEEPVESNKRKFDEAGAEEDRQEYKRQEVIDLETGDRLAAVGGGDLMSGDDVVVITDTCAYKPTKQSQNSDARESLNEENRRLEMGFQDILEVVQLQHRQNQEERGQQFATLKKELTTSNQHKLGILLKEMKRLQQQDAMHHNLHNKLLASVEEVRHVHSQHLKASVTQRHRYTDLVANQLKQSDCLLTIKQQIGNGVKLSSQQTEDYFEEFDYVARLVTKNQVILEQINTTANKQKSQLEANNLKLDDKISNIHKQIKHLGDQVKKLESRRHLDAAEIMKQEIIGREPAPAHSELSNKQLIDRLGGELGAQMADVDKKVEALDKTTIALDTNSSQDFRCGCETGEHD